MVHNQSQLQQQMNEGEAYTRPRDRLRPRSIADADGHLHAHSSAHVEARADLREAQRKGLLKSSKLRSAAMQFWTTMRKNPGDEMAKEEVNKLTTCNSTPPGSGTSTPTGSPDQAPRVDGLGDTSPAAMAANVLPTVPPSPWWRPAATRGLYMSKGKKRKRCGRHATFFK